MREHLRMRRLTLQLQPLAAAAATRGGGGGSSSSSSSDIGQALCGFFSSSLTSSDAAAVASLAALRVAAVQSFALAVAFASRSSFLLVMMGLFMETGVRMAVVLSYAAWCLIFAVGTLSATFRIG